MLRFLTVLLAAALVTAACDDDPAAPIDDATLGEMLETALQDEYEAESTYLRVLADFGPVTPFENVVYAEERHSTALLRLYDRRGITPPASAWTVNDVPRFASVPAACAAAVQAEMENVALYDGFLGADLPADVRRVFETNRAASLERHLPAFERCAP